MRHLLAALLLFCLAPLPAFAAEPTPQLTVHGQAQIEVPADQARLSLAVVSTAPDAETALTRNSKTLKLVIAALKQAGLKGDEYHTGRFEVRPEWSPRPANPAPGWQPTIRGYTVRNSLRIITGNLARLGAFIEAGTRAGANSVEGLTFDLADPAVHRALAIARATANARRDAEALAHAAGVRLGQIVSLQLDAGGYAPRPRLAAFAAGAAVPITPGTVPIRAAVTLVYQIDRR